MSTTVMTRLNYYSREGMPIAQVLEKYKDSMFARGAARKVSMEEWLNEDMLKRPEVSTGDVFCSVKYSMPLVVSHVDMNSKCVHYSTWRDFVNANRDISKAKTYTIRFQEWNDLFTKRDNFVTNLGKREEFVLPSAADKYVSIIVTAQPTPKKRDYRKEIADGTISKKEVVLEYMHEMMNMPEILYSQFNNFTIADIDRIIDGYKYDPNNPGDYNMRPWAVIFNALYRGLTLDTVQCNMRLTPFQAMAFRKVAWNWVYNRVKAIFDRGTIPYVEMDILAAINRDTSDWTTFKLYNGVGELSEVAYMWEHKSYAKKYH